MSLKDLALVAKSDTVFEIDADIEGATNSTSVPLVLSAVPVQGGMQLQFEADITAATRRTATFRSKPAVYDAKTKVWSKQKRTCAVSGPEETMGTVQAAAIRIELDVPATMDTSGIVKLLNHGIRVLSAPETLSFWTLGSPA